MRGTRTSPLARCGEAAAVVATPSLLEPGWSRHAPTASGTPSGGRRREHGDRERCHGPRIPLQSDVRSSAPDLHRRGERRFVVHQPVGPHHRLLRLVQGARTPTNPPPASAAVRALPRLGSGHRTVPRSRPRTRRTSQLVVDGEVRRHTQIVYTLMLCGSRCAGRRVPRSIAWSAAPDRSLLIRPWFAQEVMACGSRLAACGPRRSSRAGPPTGRALKTAPAGTRLATRAQAGRRVPASISRKGRHAVTWRPSDYRPRRLVLRLIRPSSD